MPYSLTFAISETFQLGLVLRHSRSCSVLDKYPASSDFALPRAFCISEHLMNSDDLARSIRNIEVTSIPHIHHSKNCSAFSALIFRIPLPYLSIPTDVMVVRHIGVV